MNKYKIGKYIVTANSICDAVSIVRQIKDTSDDFDKDYARESQAVEKDVKRANEDYNRLGNKSASELFEMMGYKRDGHKYYKSNGSYTRVIVFNDFDDIKYYVLKDGVIPRGWTLTKTKWYDSIKDADEYMIEGNIVDKDDPMMTYQAYQNIARKYHLTIKNYTGDMLDLYGSKNDLQRYERDMHMSYSSIEKVHDSIKDSSGSDIVSEVKRAYPGVEVSQIAENRSIKGENYRKTELTFDFKKIPDKFESANRMFSYIERKYSDEAQVFKKSDKTYVVTIFENLKKDSFQKDSLTVRDVIQSLINEETSAISSYNVALETLKDHIPAEAYEAIKAIRDDEQRHVENLYAVLNGNVTPKNLEN